MVWHLFIDIFPPPLFISYVSYYTVNEMPQIDCGISSERISNKTIKLKYK